MTEDNVTGEEVGTNLAAYRERRLEEIERLRGQGVNPYPYRFAGDVVLGHAMTWSFVMR